MNADMLDPVFQGGLIVAGLIGLWRGRGVGFKIRIGLAWAFLWVIIYWPLMFMGGLYGGMAEKYDNLVSNEPAPINTWPTDMPADEGIVGYSDLSNEEGAFIP